MVEERLLAPLARILQVEPAQIDDALHAKAGAWDSLEILATLALLDEHWGVSVATVELTSCTSVAAILELIERSKSAARPEGLPGIVHRG